LGDLTSLRQLLDPDLVARGLDRMQADLVAERMQATPGGPAQLHDDRRPSTINSKAWLPIVHATAYAAVAVAKDLQVDIAVMAELRRIARKIGSAFKKQRKGMTPKNKARLAQFDDPRVRRMFLNLPATVFRRHANVAKPSFKHAREIQDATVLAVLQDLPIRVGNVADLGPRAPLYPPSRRWPRSMARLDPRLEGQERRGHRLRVDARGLGDARFATSGRSAGS
jgi:hypothetical protein